MENMSIYNAVRTVPADAKKEIKGGRMNGKTDINPMWRIKALTEQFGPCGFGWKYDIIRREIVPAGDGEVAAFVDINLYVKVGGAWSDAIPGTGGNMFVAKEKNGLYVSDECFKMALTDAISVACKALGVAADVYWEKDRSKYEPKQWPSSRRQEVSERANSAGVVLQAVANLIKSNYNREKVDDLTPAEYAELLAIIDNHKEANHAQPSNPDGPSDGHA